MVSDSEHVVLRDCEFDKVFLEFWILQLFDGSGDDFLGIVGVT